MKSFLKAATGAAAAACLLATPAMAANVDGPNVFWKFSAWGKPRAFTAGVEHLAKVLDKETGGKFKLKVFYGGQLSKARENLDGLKANAFEATMFCNFYHPGKNPALMVFALPFLPLGDFDVAVKVRHGLYNHKILKDEIANWNAIYYTSTHLPQYEFLGKGEPPTKLSDWKGKRVRAGGGIGVAMEKLGAIRAAMPANEVYTAVQRGLLDAVSLPMTYSHGAYKIDEVTDWYTTNMTPGTSDCPIVFNKTAYDKLPKQYKDLIEKTRPSVVETYRAAYKKADEKYYPRFNKKLKKLTYDAKTLEEFRKIGGKPVWDQWIAENKDKFDSKLVFDLVWKIAKEAEAEKKKK